MRCLHGDTFDRSFEVGGAEIEILQTWLRRAGAFRRQSQKTPGARGISFPNLIMLLPVKSKTPGRHLSRMRYILQRELLLKGIHQM